MQESFLQLVALPRRRLSRLSTCAVSAGLLPGSLSRAHCVLMMVTTAGLCHRGSPEWDGLFAASQAVLKD